MQCIRWPSSFWNDCSQIIRSLDWGIPNLNQISFGNSKHNPAIVEIYVLPDCPWSKRALKLLVSSRIKYYSYMITNDEEFKKLSNSSSISTFPQIFRKDRFTGCYSELAKLSDKGDLTKISY